MLLALSVIGMVTALITFPIARGDLWRKLVMIGSLACIGFAIIGLERIQIMDSKERMCNFWAYIQNVQKFLSENGVRNVADVELIKARIDNRVEKLQKAQQKLKEGDEKWIQTLAIPTVLALIGLPFTVTRKQSSSKAASSSIFPSFTMPMT